MCLGNITSYWHNPFFTLLIQLSFINFSLKFIYLCSKLHSYIICIIISVNIFFPKIYIVIYNAVKGQYLLWIIHFFHTNQETSATRRPRLTKMAFDGITFDSCCEYVIMVCIQQVFYQISKQWRLKNWGKQWTFWSCSNSVCHQKKKSWFAFSLHFYISRLVLWIETLFGITNNKLFIKKWQVISSIQLIRKATSNYGCCGSWYTAKANWTLSWLLQRCIT